MDCINPFCYNIASIFGVFCPKCEAALRESVRYSLLVNHGFDGVNETSLDSLAAMNLPGV